MATFSFSSTITPIFLLFSLLPLELGFLRGVTPLGINYGQLADNLPQPEQVRTLLTSLKVTKTRIYDTNPQILTAFANSGIEIIVMVPNNLVSTLTDPGQALQWVTTNIKPYFPSTKITGIDVGNEVFASNDATLTSNLVPAMSSIHAALVQLGLDASIHVSTASSLAVLAESFPPSSGAFQENLANVIAPFLEFLTRTKGTFWINAYPYFSYKADPNGVSLDYVLFNPNSGMIDPKTNLHYNNMLYAMVDAVSFAISRMGFDGLDVGVSETGWPSKGDSEEVGATIENARVYNKNLVQRQMLNEGTPYRPNQRLEIYMFALFNEYMKPGPTSERNYGLYHPDITMVYNVGLTELSGSTATSTSVSFVTSSATKAASKVFGSLGYWILVHMMTFQALRRWLV